MQHLNDLFPFPFPWMDDLFQKRDEKQISKQKKERPQIKCDSHKQMKMFFIAKTGLWTVFASLGFTFFCALEKWFFDVFIRSILSVEHAVQNNK